MLTSVDVKFIFDSACLWASLGDKGLFAANILRDRSFFMREGGWWDLGEGHSKKIGLKGGGQPKKNEGRRGSDEKIRLKIG